MDECHVAGGGGEGAHLGGVDEGGPEHKNERQQVDDVGVGERDLQAAIAFAFAFCCCGSLWWLGDGMGQGGGECVAAEQIRKATPTTAPGCKADIYVHVHVHTDTHASLAYSTTRSMPFQHERISLMDWSMLMRTCVWGERVWAC